MRELVIDALNAGRILSWAETSNMCPVSAYVVQHELVYRDQCQSVKETYIDVNETLSLSYSWQEPVISASPHFPHSTYKIRVRARNEAGLGAYENTANDEFTTASAGENN